MAFFVPIAAALMAGGTVYSAIQQKKSADAQADAAENAARAQRQAQARQKELQSQQEQIQKKQEEESQRKATLLSDEVRRKSTARGRRSLLSGDETGVGEMGLRGVTG